MLYLLESNRIGSQKATRSPFARIMGWPVSDAAISFDIYERARIHDCHATGDRSLRRIYLFLGSGLAYELDGCVSGADVRDSAHEKTDRENLPSRVDV